MKCIKFHWQEQEGKTTLVGSPAGETGLETRSAGGLAGSLILVGRVYRRRRRRVVWAVILGHMEITKA